MTGRPVIGFCSGGGGLSAKKTLYGLTAKKKSRGS
jgi:hypothetical protein